MIWRRLERLDIILAGARARREHEAWLTQAISEPERWPRIPTRRVSDGGFTGLMSTAEGRDWAMSWWRHVLVDADSE